MNNSLVLILGAGKPYSGDQPSALVETPDGSRRVLDWLLEAFACLPNKNIYFIGGYRFESVVERYPNILFSVNSGWRSSGPAGSLLVAPLMVSAEAYVCYADVVFEEAAVRALRSSDADINLCIDRQWRERYTARSKEDLNCAEKVALDELSGVRIGRDLPIDECTGELVGLFKFSSRATALIQQLRSCQEFQQLDIPGLLMHLIDAGMTTQVVDVQGRWAELNAPQDLAHFVLGTKAETLERLQPLVTCSSIGEQYRFTSSQWREAPQTMIAGIRARFGDARLVVRSSAMAEDCWERSNAGNFTSVLDVDCADDASLRGAIEEVIASYKEGSPADQVLVQELLTDVALSGVIFTRTLSSGAPYYQINYDAESGRTDSVTAGDGIQLNMLMVFRDYAGSGAVDPRLEPVLEAVAELEELVGHNSLDIEFTVTSDGQVHVLQIRPIAVEHAGHLVEDQWVRQALEQASRRIQDESDNPGLLFGKRALYGVMPDWNPAEIIGTKPRRLAHSLYQKLVTDEVWATQRAEYGYREVRPCALLHNFAGHPYVDIRASFNSFIPATLDDDLGERLVTHYLDRLEQYPHLHDKVEFNIAFTCFSFDFDTRAGAQLGEAGFDAQDRAQLKTGLLEITRAGIERIERDLEEIALLERRFALILEVKPPLKRMFLLLEDCRRYGSLPFAHLARAGFVAMTLLRSLQTQGVISADQLAGFLASLGTVTRQFEQDGARVERGELDWDVLVARYGHLRPGTYEITSAAYGADPERYIRPMVKEEITEPPAFDWGDQSRAGIEKALDESGMGIDLAAFERFLRQAIEGREFSKFIFTRNLSQGLEAIAEFGQSQGLDRPQLSHLDIDDLYRCYLGNHSAALKRWLVERSEEGEAAHRLTQSVELPSLICQVADLFCFERPASQPNFVSNNGVIADLVTLRDGDRPDDLTGRIVMIERADPGFDWLFAHGIAGLVTTYGGANSHMAIRAAELSLPAAIGIGETLFEQLRNARVVELDAAAHRLRVVH